MKKKSKKEIKRLEKIPFDTHFCDLAAPETDPDGSYTGTVTSAPWTQPVQDADDL